MQYFFIENKISDSQEGAKLCIPSIFPDGEEVYNRQKHHLPCTHGRASFFPFFLNQRSNPSSVRAGLSIYI